MVLTAIALLLFALWVIDLSTKHAHLRTEIERRVGWMIRIHEAQRALKEGQPLPGLPLEALNEAFADDPGIRASLASLQDSPPEEAASVLHDLVPAIRGQTAELSARLGEQWRQLDALALSAIVLAGGVLGLLLLLRRRHRQLGLELQRRIGAEQGLTLLERQLELLGVGLCTVEPDLRLLRTSGLCDQMYSAWEDPHRWWAALLEAVQLPEPVACAACGRPEQRGTVLARIVPPDTVRPSFFELTLGGHGHQTGGAVVMVRDVTGQGQLEERVAVADRLATIGTLTAEVAHEINNPLTSLLINLDLLQQSMASGTDPEAWTEMLAEAVSVAQRIRGVARDLREVVHSSSTSRTPVDLGEVVATTSRLVAPQLRGGSQHLIIEVAPELPRVCGIGPQLAQVLLNLLINAIQALPDEPQHHIHLRAFPQEGGVVLEVEDDGPGIPKSHQACLFEPFFTTKAPGEGTGLGLYVCRQIVDAHGGSIEAESEPGRTVMRVRLPTGLPECSRA